MRSKDKRSIPRRMQGMICLALAVALLQAGCAFGTEDPGERMERESMEIAAVCKDAYLAAEKITAEFPVGSAVLSQRGMDEVESCLIDAGYATLDTQGEYPSYLANQENVYAFWERVQSGEAAEMRFLRVLESGGFSYMLFCFDGCVGRYYVADTAFDSKGDPSISRLEERQIIDWALTEKGNFYYQILPSDLHYIDYASIRLVPPDRELYDLTLRYITPVGYQATNLFLCDWNEKDFGNLSFNDVFPYLYLMKENKSLNADDFPQHEQPAYSMIPGSLFEETVLSWFPVSQEELRRRAMYDPETDSYPWKQQGTNDFVYFPFLETEVIGYTSNPDGTMTLTVNAGSPELKTDELFGHEVTIRPLKDGGFQYVGNRITYQTEYGLPPNTPCLSRDDLE